MLVVNSIPPSLRNGIIKRKSTNKLFEEYLNSHMFLRITLCDFELEMDDCRLISGFVTVNAHFITTDDGV